MGRMYSIFVLGLTWLSLSGIWFLYTNSLGWREVIAGTLAAALSTLGVIVYSRQANVRFRFRLSDVAQGI
jgi:hypothetical protein